MNDNIIIRKKMINNATKCPQEQRNQILKSNIFNALNIQQQVILNVQCSVF